MSNVEKMKVISARLIAVGIVKIMFIGVRSECMNFIQKRNGEDCDLMHSSGRLASWVI